jgi:hypothetical protein
MPNVLNPSPSNTPSYKGETSTPGVTPYAEDLLKRGQAYTNAPVPVYGGKLTTGPSQYQNQAWQGLSNLALPENSKFGTAQAEQYMNPYIEASLNPQLDLMRRNAAINQQGDMAKLAQAGAFGGSRQAVLQGLNQESLMRQQAATTGSAYEKAYNAAMAQFNADQGNQRSNLNALSTAGATQQDLEQNALDAQYKDWLRQTGYPGKQLEMQKGLISGLAPYMPKSELAYGQKQSALQTAAGGVAGLTKLANDLGIPLDTLKSVFGITGLQSAANEANKTASDSSYGYIGNTPGARAGTDTPEGTHRDSDGNLVDDSTGEILGAEGGLMGMLHKMRGQK